ncbi:hypothetical protein B0T24DRAFT_680462 [Lasiosphaeria ovina]|uniref:Uncharacterized protein n=1 Tax=Lasiosphaeria ovina TaxID=92902 RepID=A0AAE0K8I9_9PEZI|nr:hypothetical protein B0T24DRAFT_680462 [Lasiosphaeria ovina]
MTSITTKFPSVLFLFIVFMTFSGFAVAIDPVEAALDVGSHIAREAASKFWEWVSSGEALDDIVDVVTTVADVLS